MEAVSDPRADVPNPWLTPAADIDVPTPAAPKKRSPDERGPKRPQSRVPAPDVVDRLAHRPVQAQGVWLVGVHGGAGTSTLRCVLPGSADADRAWPFYANQAARATVLLVARTSAHGLSRAQTAAQEWAASTTPHINLLGLALVPDAPGRLPRALRNLVQLVSGGVPRVWTLPWHEPWRLGHPATPESAPPQYRKLADDVSRLTPTTNER